MPTKNWKVDLKNPIITKAFLDSQKNTVGQVGCQFIPNKYIDKIRVEYVKFWEKRGGIICH